MTFTDDELSTLWAACDNLAVSAILRRSKGGYNTYSYVVESNELLKAALNLRQRLADELEARKGATCDTAIK